MSPGLLTILLELKLTLTQVHGCPPHGRDLEECFFLDELGHDDQSYTGPVGRF